jgi:AcrR family transcriptional regulator
MGSKERVGREKEAVRAAILQAARELFVAEGYRNVSMRKLAERIEYSPAAIYSYFPAKDDIFFALADEGFRLLGEAGDRIIAGHTDPLETVRELFWAYYRFSREQPQFFELMFLDRTVPQISEEWERFSFVMEMMRGMSAVVQRCIDSGVFAAGTNPDAAFHILWAATHGPAAIALCGRLSPGEDADALARDAIETALAGLRAGVRTTFVPERCHSLAPHDDSSAGDTDHVA